MSSVQEQYEAILLQNGIEDKVKEVDVSLSGAKGDGFASVTKRVVVRFEDENKEPLKFFVKMHTDNPSHEQFVADLKAFEKEAEFFMEYLPEATKFCKEKGLPDLVDIYPKCYFGDDQLIVLEDLVLDRGYEMLPASEKHDYIKTTYALETLAKHHALSFAMMQNTGGDELFFKKFPNLKYDSFNAMMPMMDNFGNPLTTSLEILQANPVEGGAEAISFIKKFVDMKYSDVIKDSWAFVDPSDALVLLNHGDYKHNNMMFKIDKETKSILHHIAIDLQVTRYDSPVWDLAFYLYSSVDNTVRQNHVQEFLKNYISILNKVSESLGHPTNLEFEDLWRVYRKKFSLGFWGALVMVGPGNEIMKGMDIDTQDFSNMGEYFKEALDKWFAANKEKGVAMAEEIVGLVKEYKSLDGE